MEPALYQMASREHAVVLHRISVRFISLIWIITCLSFSTSEDRNTMQCLGCLERFITYGTVCLGGLLRWRLQDCPPQVTHLYAKIETKQPKHLNLIATYSITNDFTLSNPSTYLGVNHAGAAHLPF